MKKILLASDDLGFSKSFIQLLNSIQHDYEGFEIIQVSNFEDLLYKLFFENFDADILFMNLNVCQIDSSLLSFFEKDLQNTMNNILSTSSNVEIAIAKICQCLVDDKYNKQLDIIFLDSIDILNKITNNEILGIDLNSPDFIADVKNILDLIQEKTLK